MSEPATTPTVQVVPAAAPRAGDLTIGWRVVVACLWIAVITAFAAVWSVSVQLGLSTWWLGPRSARQPLPIQLIPFVAPLLMALAAFNNVRRLVALGVAASLVTAVIGIGDLGRVTELALLELLIAALALVVTVASRTGVFRVASPEVGVPAGDAQPVTP